ncbi:MAG: hypothetical protein JJ911_19115 [Rhizobiaceae bacterium]|nr:hypothetical protein [Rhizobiaceae bacterium]
MAQSRDYEVALYPAHRDGNFVVTKFDMTGTYPRHRITAAGMTDLVDQITEIAMAHGEGCRASVRVLGGRKPPGFKAATEDLYFNLKTKEQLAAEAAADAA